ncbi:cell cycle checkpoint protein RAD17-like isoform X1 [Daphnia pulicaria]|uniref:cell cycle checkpoint protein RAD17-like isoform X1 n=2 Tax=Daphnia pulicaria TaxID=35523 RepID=UPI001EEC7BB6|nr:cell cycle checkpoint protein RAD17-like isoform X1 [Daphnia pulicaria]
MSQKGWVKPDFAKGSEGYTHSTKKQCSSKSLMYDSARVKQSTESTECTSTPVNSSELVVQKKKVAEVKHWLEQAFSKSQQGQFLLLTGPPGCGKYQTLSVLCKELNIEILAWEEPIKHFEASEWEYEQYNPHHYREPKQKDVNFYDHLEEFLERANRFSTLKMKDAKGSVAHNSNMRKILLIKEFPPMIFKNLERWHNILLKYSHRTITPAVFILTSTKAFNSTQLKLFPTVLSERLMMSTVNFTGLANTFVLKALQRVSLKSKQATPPEVIEGIVGSCNGDLRSALNAMHWITTSNVNVKKPPAYSKKRKLASVEKKDSLNTMYVRDGSLDFMHAIGKILHSKRLDQVQGSLPELPKHLLEEFRLPLKEDVNELTKNIDEASSKVLLYLHQNYPLYFNRIEDVSKAVGYLSSADSLGNQLVYKDIFDEWSLLTGVRGLLFSNTSVNGSAWRPLRKPDYYSVLQQQQELHMHVQDGYGNKCGPSFFSETLPFINLIRSGSKITDGLKSTSGQLNYHQFQVSQSTDFSANVVDFVNSNGKKDRDEDADIIIEDYDD